MCSRARGSWPTTGRLERSRRRSTARWCAGRTRQTVSTTRAVRNAGGTFQSALAVLRTHWSGPVAHRSGPHNPSVLRRRRSHDREGLRPDQTTGREDAWLALVAAHDPRRARRGQGGLQEQARARRAAVSGTRPPNIRFRGEVVRTIWTPPLRKPRVGPKPPTGPCAWFRRTGTIVANDGHLWELRRDGDFAGDWRWWELLGPETQHSGAES